MDRIKCIIIDNINVGFVKGRFCKFATELLDLTDVRI